MFSFLKKKIEVPVNNELKEVDAIQMWSVRWDARYGAFYEDVRQCAEWFPSETDANNFAESLRAAYKLIRHTSGTNVVVTKEK